MRGEQCNHQDAVNRQAYTQGVRGFSVCGLGFVEHAVARATYSIDMQPQYPQEVFYVLPVG